MNADHLLVIDEKDNVAVALSQIGNIPKGHKVARTDIPAGTPVLKYGHTIGISTQFIAAGEWVHTHNLKSQLDEHTGCSYSFQCVIPKEKQGAFWGYPRQNSRAGIRNDIYIIPTVGCVNNVCLQLEKAAQKLIHGSIDGIFALTHQFGCSQLGEDHQNFQNLLCGIAQNPNASFVLFVGLGCENNQLSEIRQRLSAKTNIAYLNCQDVQDEYACGMKILENFSKQAAILVRQECDLSQLCIGLKCGGSDGFSGITANPLVGKVTDTLVGYGGGAILTEIPEMFGAEQQMMNKCRNQKIYEEYVAMIEEFKAFYLAQGFPVYENPSPGNRAGGITTLEEKSLGCVQKAGTTAINSILKYGETVTSPGVSILSGPGNDLVAATALAASGCQMVLFTTGRGTPFSTFVPTLKISTNPELASKKPHWIDFDASSMDQQGLMNMLLAVANGAYICKSEDIREIAFFKTGITL